MKKNTILLLLSIFLISGCEDCGGPRGEPRPVHAANKGENYDVRLLFEVDGVKVYRFYDGEGHVYFTNTNGITRTERAIRAGNVAQTVPVVTYCNRR